MYVKQEKNSGTIQESRKQKKQKGMDMTSSLDSALPLRGNAVIGIVIGIMEHLMPMRDYGFA
jgi:hypothetical protein